MGTLPKETVDPGAACSHLPPLILLAMATHVTTVIFKKKRDVIQSHGDGKFEHCETVKWLVNVICPTEN